MATYQILIEQLDLDLAQLEITPKIEQIAKLLIETDGESSRPPLVKASGFNIVEAYEMYKLVADSEIGIAAKLAETQGLERLTVIIADNKLAEMENLLNEPKKIVKPKKIAEPKKMTKEEWMKFMNE